jgi:hypothetical protein
MLLLRQVSREVIDNLTVEQLHEFVQARGFKRAAPEEPEQPPSPGARASCERLRWHVLLWCIGTRKCVQMLGGSCKGT